MLNKDEIKDWKNNEVTKELYKIIQQARELAISHLLNNDPEKTHSNSESIGFIRGLDLILDADLGDDENK